MSRVFAVPARSERALLDALRERFGLAREVRTVVETTFYDTFDWRLFRNGATLTGQTGGDGGTLWLHALDGTLLHRAPGAAAPEFLDDLPAGPLRRELSPWVEMRRLFPVVRTELRRREFPLVDQRKKTLARLRLERGHASPPDNASRRRLSPTLTVAELRGYEDQAEAVARYLEQELRLERVEPHAIARALVAIGREPGDVKTKLRVRLKESMRTDEALRKILRKLLQAIELNEEGTRKDLDTEFLHDFRVAVRRTRSALSQIKGVLPDAPLERFRSEFKWLGNLTGPTRDLDVYLLKLPAYRSLLSEELGTHLDPLERLLTEKQRAEHARLVSGLDSERYGKLVADWRGFLEAGTEDEAPPNADRPVREVASARIRRAFRRVLKRGRDIDDDSPAELLHRLRIDCKKLRYLLEFFSTLYDPEEIGRLVKALKRLQDNLGDYNDYEVQQAALEGFARDLAAHGDTDELALLALGRLVERLAVEQRELRHRFRKRFVGFAGAETRARVRTLFGDRGPAH